MIQSFTVLLRRCKQIAAVIALITASAAAANPVPISELAKPGRVLLLRHAIAPGVGDPPQFQLRRPVPEMSRSTLASGAERWRPLACSVSAQ